jgi:hypothetical protein
VSQSELVGQGVTAGTASAGLPAYVTLAMISTCRIKPAKSRHPAASVPRWGIASSVRLHASLTTESVGRVYDSGQLLSAS